MGANTNIADDVNASVSALPNNAVADAYVWMEYHNLEDDTNTNTMWLVSAPAWTVGTAAPAFASEPALSYPFSTDEQSPTAYQPESGSGITKYWESTKTRFPDFTNSEFASCGQVMQLDTAASNDMAAEGLCIFISSSNKVNTNYVVTYNTNPVVTVTDTGVDTSYNAETMTGYSTSIERTARATGKASNGDLDAKVTVLNQGTYIDGTMIPVVTVEEVGHHRYWDVNID